MEVLFNAFHLRRVFTWVYLCLGLIMEVCVRVCQGGKFLDFGNISVMCETFAQPMVGNPDWRRSSQLGIRDDMCLNHQTSNRPEDVMRGQMILLRYKTRHRKRCLDILELNCFRNVSTLRNSCIMLFHGTAANQYLACVCLVNSPA